MHQYVKKSETQGFLAPPNLKEEPASAPRFRRLRFQTLFLLLFYDLDWFHALLLILVFPNLLGQGFFHLTEFAAGIVKLRSAVRQLVFISGQHCNPLCT